MGSMDIMILGWEYRIAAIAMLIKNPNNLEREESLFLRIGLKPISWKSAIIRKRMITRFKRLLAANINVPFWVKNRIPKAR